MVSFFFFFFLLLVCSSVCRSTNSYVQVVDGSGPSVDVGEVVMGATWTDPKSGIGGGATSDTKESRNWASNPARPARVSLGMREGEGGLD
ncbi:hypothetical protein B0J13DRAFT_227384 [Dactylonectria estremocensis]|uniref:Secreted protein n=1 Tax=Dactylonectria estremocensis TaxID=1079267 RepID=A0A9P9JCZ2_9HYPO|nr:hypothetical protein B0J13DRAFT_227384 [Dactylonectria estremocensis]